VEVGGKSVLPIQVEMPRDIIGDDPMDNIKLVNNFSQLSAAIVTDLDSYDLSVCFPRLSRRLKRTSSDEHHITAGLGGPLKVARGPSDTGSTPEGEEGSGWAAGSGASAAAKAKAKPEAQAAVASAKASGKAKAKPKAKARASGSSHVPPQPVLHDAEIPDPVGEAK
jgi:hypothetical protein